MMGVAVSLSTANMVMKEIIRTGLESFSEKSKLFLRYLDDCYRAIEEKAADNFLLHLYLSKAAVQFTMARETDILPSLGVFVRRQPD